MSQTQKIRLLNHLKQHGTIEPLVALRDLGIYRLAAVIFLLRQDGHEITKEMKKAKNQFGEKCCYAEYELKSYIATTSTGMDAASEYLKAQGGE